MDLPLVLSIYLSGVLVNMTYITIREKTSNLVEDYHLIK